MNFKKLFKLSMTVFTFLVVLSGVSLAQIYVDATNGNDGTGLGTAVSPYASIAKGLSKLATSGGTVVIKAGTYDGATLGGGVDINIAASAAMGIHTLPAFADGAVITLQLEKLAGNPNNEVKIVDAGNANGTGPDFTFNIKNGTLNIVSANGTEYLNLSDTQSDLVLGSTGKPVTVNINTATGASATNVLLRNGAAITLWDTSSLPVSAPTKTTAVSVVYLGTGSLTAGPESNYGSYGGGSITVNKTAAANTVTFPNAITSVTGIIVTQGSATFSGAVTSAADVTIAGGGAVSFQNLTMSTFDFTHSGTGAVTINGTLNFSILNGALANGIDTDLGSLENTAGGSITVLGTTTWTGGTFGADVSFVNAGEQAVINSGAGTVTLGAISLVANDAGANRKFDFIAENSGVGGKLTLGVVTAAATTTNTNFGTLNVLNSNTGTLTVGGGNIRGYLDNTVGASGTIVISGTTTVNGMIWNAAGKKITLNADLTLTGAVTHNLFSTSVIDGTSKLLVTGNAATFDNPTAAATVAKISNLEIASAAGSSATFVTSGGAGAKFQVTGNLTVNNDLNLGDGALTAALAPGAFTVDGQTTVNGGIVTIDNENDATATTMTVNGLTQTGGTITLDPLGGAGDADGGILAIGGTFSRSNGTFTSTDVSSLVNVNGSGPQQFDGGSNFQVLNITFSNTGGLVNLGNSIRVAGICTVNASVTIELGNLNIIINAAGAGITNNGTIQTTGVSTGAVIFGGTNFVPGGVAAAGMILNAASTALFSNIIVDVGSANTVVTTGSSGNIRWTKELYLYTGDITVNDGTGTARDLAPSGTGASIKRDISTAAGSTNGILLAGNDTFNAAAVDYDLTYTGTLTAGKTINTTTSVEYAAGNVRNLTVSAGGGSFVVTLAGNVARTLKGNLVVTGNSTAASASRLTLDNAVLTVNGNASIGQNSVLTIDGTAGANVEVKGALTVSASADVTGGNAGSTLTLSGDSQSHSVTGKITAVSVLTVSGTTVAINGSTTSGATVAEIANLSVAASKVVTVSNIQRINGAVTTGASSGLTVGLSAPDAGDGVITGAITLGGSAFAITSNIEAQAGVTHNKGSFDFDGKNLTLTTAGAFTRAADASAVYTSSGGYLIQNFATLNLNLNGGTIPYVEIKAATTLGGNMTVANNLKHTAGSITSGGNNITISSGMTTTGGAADFTGAGKIVLAGTTVTASGNPAWSNLEINSDGTAVLATSDPTTPAARTWTISGVLTQTKGILDLGINTVSLTGAAPYNRTAGSIIGTGVLQLAGAVAQTVAQGVGFSIPNLEIVNTAGTAADVTFASGATNEWTVTGTLSLTTGTLEAGADAKMHMAAGSTISRNAAASSLAKVPAFDGLMNVTYKTGTGNTAKELPAATDKLQDLTLNLTGIGNIITTTANVTVNGTIYLTVGTLEEGTKAVTLVDGGTINRTGNGTFDQTTPDVPSVQTYKVVYSGAVNINTSGSDLLAGALSVEVKTTAGAITKIGANQAINGPLTLNAAGANGGLDLNSKTLTVAGDVTVTAGYFQNSNAVGTGKLEFNGTVNQKLTVPAAGLQFPNGAAAANMQSSELVINNAAGVTLAQGDLSFADPKLSAVYTNILRLTKGNLTVPAGKSLRLWHCDTGGSPVQGYARTAGNVVGNVTKYLDATDAYYGGAGVPSVALTRVEFPVGSAANYKPMAFQFNTLPSANFNLTVNEVEGDVGGTNGFPITDNTLTTANKQLANYPGGLLNVNGNGFYWLVTSDLTLQPQVKYDIEAKAYGYTPANYPEGVQNVRFLRRFDTNTDNPWLLQGGLGYDNASFDYLGTAILTDDATSIIVRSAEGAISTQGARFTYSQAAKAPLITTALAAVSVDENSTLTVTWVKTSQNIGGVTAWGTPVWNTATAPEGAAIVNGVLTWKPTYSQAGNYTVKVIATEGSFTTENLVTITVNDKPQPLTFTTATATKNVATVAGKTGVALALSYEAQDKDGGTPTYTMVVNPAPTAASAPVLNPTTGAFTWTPAYTDINVFTVTVTASVGTAPAVKTADFVTTITVTSSAVKGDADVDGDADQVDASLILKHVVGLITLKDAAFEGAAMPAAPVNEVGAIDAAYVLYKVANGTWPTAKLAAAAGSVEFGKFASNNGTLSLPINLQNSRGVLSVYTEVVIGSEVDYKGVGANLPEGWQVVSNFENGVLKVAMAGTTPLTDGSIANINIALKNPEAVVSVSGNVKMNDEISAAMQSVKVREIPADFNLSQNYPNPFNPTTNIKYAISADSRVSLVVYNILGQVVRTLVDNEQEAGFYTVRWDGTNDFGSKVSSGIYIYRITAGNFVSTIKMNLLK